ncbi:MAG: hypothetical protein K8T25_10865 [Planctomycetia bacterium]|nr:hypothetical protein [Planctomycetia bacterium]
MWRWFGFFSVWILIIMCGRSGHAQIQISFEEKYSFSPIFDRPTDAALVLVDERARQTVVRFAQLHEQDRIAVGQSIAEMRSGRSKPSESICRQYDQQFLPGVPDWSNQSVPLTDYKSTHIALKTDLPPQEAKYYLNTLEAMFEKAAAFWRRKPSGRLACYVCRDLDRWKSVNLPPVAIAKIKAHEGVTMGATTAAPSGAPKKKPSQSRASIAYCSDRIGVAQHEIVHAYCDLAFGKCGPFWYAEGMAELGSYMREGDPSVCVPYATLWYLHTSPPLSVAKVIERNPSMENATWEDYARCWALCHLLNSNPSYTKRFRALGLGILGGQGVKYSDVFAAQQANIEFEYQFFVKNVEPGYRADLCCWEWSDFRTLGDAEISPTVDARRGWQASGGALEANHQYSFQAEGQWRLKKDGPQLSAAGQPRGRGKLLGVLMDNRVLGRPFELGVEGRFVAPSNGNLYLRCGDNWSAIADHEGSVNFKIRAAKESK